MTNLIIKLNSAVSLFFAKLRSPAPKGHFGVFHYARNSKEPVTSGLFRKRRIYRLIPDEVNSILNIRSLVTAIRHGSWVCISDVSFWISDTEKVDVSFTAVNFEASDRTEIDYVLSVVHTEGDTMTVITSRTVAKLKSLATNFTLQFNWKEKTVQVYTPIKMQSQEPHTVQYTAKLPNHFSGVPKYATSNVVRNPEYPLPYEVVRAISII
jgi:hypothetical protein